MLLNNSNRISPKSRLRSLSPFETFMWLMDLRSPLHATLAGQVSGLTTIEDWRLALDKTRRRHPLWSTVIAEGVDGFPFFKNMETPHVAFRVVRGDFASCWEEEVSKEVGTPIDPANGPLVRATLLYTEARSMLILSAHHSICDGLSLAFALRDVLRCLSGQELELLPTHVSLEEALEVAAQPHRAAQSNHEAIGIGASEVFHVKTSALPKVQSLKLSSNTTTKLRARARTERTTLHGALIAAASMAARRDPHYRASQDLRICSTVNNRKLLGLPEDFSMLFTAFVDLFPDEEPSSFWDLARVAKSHLEPLETIAGSRAVLAAVNDATAQLLSATKDAGQAGSSFPLDITISNLGVLPIETSYGNISLESMWGPAVLNGYEGEQTLGAITVNDTLCLLHTSHSALASFLVHIEQILVANL